MCPGFYLPMNVPVASNDENGSCLSLRSSLRTRMGEYLREREEEKKSLELEDGRDTGWHLPSPLP